MADPQLKVEKVWTYPEAHVHYLQKGCITVQVRNLSEQPLEIDAVECYFELDDEDHDPYVARQKHYERLVRGNLSAPITVEFEADLAIKTFTNNLRLVVRYNDGDFKTLSHDPHKYLIFLPLGAAEQHFFISHKDPEDTELGEQLASFLGKLGLGGYLAEVDKRPGIDFWKDKIPPAVSTSVGAVFLWTSNAATNPTNILRELDLAKSAKKPVIVAVEAKVSVPDIFPTKKKEYHRFGSPLARTELKKLAQHIHRVYRDGGYLRKS